MSCNIGQNDLNLKGCHWCQQQVNTKLQMCIDCLDAPGDSTPAEGTFVYLSNFTECWSGTEKCIDLWLKREMLYENMIMAQVYTEKKCKKYFPVRFLLVALALSSLFFTRLHHFYWITCTGWSTLCCFQNNQNIIYLNEDFYGVQLFYTAQWQQHEYFTSSNVLNYHTMKAIDNNKCRWIKTVMKITRTLCASVSTQSNGVWCKLLHSSRAYCIIQRHWVFRSELSWK